jgi:Nuclear pore component
VKGREREQKRRGKKLTMAGQQPFQLRFGPAAAAQQAAAGQPKAGAGGPATQAQAQAQPGAGVARSLFPAAGGAAGGGGLPPAPGLVFGSPPGGAAAPKVGLGAGLGAPPKVGLATGLGAPPKVGLGAAAGGGASRFPTPASLLAAYQQPKASSASAAAATAPKSAVLGSVAPKFGAGSALGSASAGVPKVGLGGLGASSGLTPSGVGSAGMQPPARAAESPGSGASELGSMALTGQPKPAITLMGQPKPASTLMGQPKPAITLMGQPKPATALTAQPKPAITLMGQPKPAITLMGQPKPAITLTAQPKPAITLTAQQPKPAITVAAQQQQPKPGITLMGQPKPVTSLMGQAKPVIPLTGGQPKLSLGAQPKPLTMGQTQQQQQQQQPKQTTPASSPLSLSSLSMGQTAKKQPGVPTTPQKQSIALSSSARDSRTKKTAEATSVSTEATDLARASSLNNSNRSVSEDTRDDSGDGSGESGQLAQQTTKTHSSRATPAAVSARVREALEGHPVFLSSTEDTNAESSSRAWHATCATQTFCVDDDRNWVIVLDVPSGEIRVLSLSRFASDNGDSSGNSNRSSAYAVLKCAPGLQFDPCRVEFNRSRTHLLVAGDRGLAVIPVTAKVEHGVASCEREGSSNVVVKVHCSHLAETLFRRRSSLRVVDATWHPLSSEHAAVLGSDNTLRLFDIKRAGDQHAEQLLTLPAHAAKASGLCFLPPELEPMTRPGARRSRASKKRVHAMSRHWQSLSAFVVCTDGSVYVVTPLVPYHAHVNRRILRELGQNARRNSVNCGTGGGGVDAEYWETVCAWLSDVQVPDDHVGHHTTRRPSRRSPLTAKLVPQFQTLAGPCPIRSGALLGPEVLRYALSCTAHPGPDEQTHVLCLVRASATGMLSMFLGAVDAIVPAWGGVVEEAFESADSSKLLFEFPEELDLNLGLAQHDFNDIEDAMVADSSDEDEFFEDDLAPKKRIAGRSRPEFAFRPTRPPLSTISVTLIEGHGPPSMLVRHALGAHRVCLTWLPMIHEMFAASSEAAQTHADLPPTGAEWLLDSHPLETRGERRMLLQTPLGVCFVMDLSLMGSEVMLLETRVGRTLVMRAPGPYHQGVLRDDDTDTRRKSKRPIPVKEAAAQLVPRATRFDFPKSQAADVCTPESLGLLLDAIERLRGDHVDPIRSTYEAIVLALRDQDEEMRTQVRFFFVFLPHFITDPSFPFFFLF